jgi:hypothetical protein
MLSKATFTLELHKDWALVRLSLEHATAWGANAQTAAKLNGKVYNQNELNLPRAKSMLIL